MIVATAGHIDHGKTTLVKALTGVDTDRLPEEKRRGISIDLGFAYWHSPGDGATVGLVDVPGHERFVHNMLAGVCGIDCALIVVAADDGPKPQTIEHLHIVDLLAVRGGIAVITKVDRVSRQRVEDVTALLRDLLAPTCLAGIDILSVSAVSGEGMDELRAALAALARSVNRKQQEGRVFRYGIDRAFSVPGSGTVVTGTVFGGAVVHGDKLTISPVGIQVRVRAIQKDGKAAERAVAGERCALNLPDLELAAAGRGDWLMGAQLHAPTRRMDVRLRILASEARPIKHWTPIHFHHGAADVGARIVVRGGGEIAPGASATVQIVLDRPVAALNGDRFVIRDQSASRTIGGGLVIDPSSPARCKNQSQRAVVLKALDREDPAQALGALQTSSPAGIDLGWFGRIFGLSDDHLLKLAQDSGLVILGKEPLLGLPRTKIEAIEAKILRTLTTFHASAPRELGMEIATLREQCAADQPIASLLTVLRQIADRKQIVLSGSIARLINHVATNNRADDVLWRRICPILDAAGFNGLAITELASAARTKEPQLRDFLHRKSKTGEVVHVTRERFYLRSTLARFAAIVDGVARSVQEGKFTAAQVRDRADIGRTRVIEILECFDRLGITLRAGDLRSIRKDFMLVLGASPAGDPLEHRPSAR